MSWPARRAPTPIPTRAGPATKNPSWGLKKDGQDAVIKGAFDMMCPYTKPGEPCLDKPAAP